MSKPDLRNGVSLLKPFASYDELISYVRSGAPIFYAGPLDYYPKRIIAVRLSRNAVVCLTCGEFVQSQSVHDYGVCRCPLNSNTAVSVDGGTEYQKRGFSSASHWIEVDGSVWKGGAKVQCK